MKTPRNAEETLNKLFDAVSKKTLTEAAMLHKDIVFRFTNNADVYIYHIHTGDGTPVVYREWSGGTAHLEVACSVATWMRVSRKAINPLWAVVRKKLKIKGDKGLLQILSFSDRIPKVFPGMNDLPNDSEYSHKRKWTIPKKALIISASARGSEGYTHLFLDRMVTGMQKLGVECNVVVLSEMDIQECMGCWHCWIVGNGKCVIDDDMTRLNELYVESDLIVHGFPVYLCSMPGLLKKYLDRMVCLFEPFMIEGVYKVRHPTRNPGMKYQAVLSVSGYSERSSFNAIEPYYKELCHNFHLGMTDFIFIPEASFVFNSPLAYDVASRKLELLEIAGQQLAQYGKIQKRVLKELGKPLFPPRKIKTWIDFANLSWSVRLEKKDLIY